MNLEYWKHRRDEYREQLRHLEEQEQRVGSISDQAQREKQRIQLELVETAKAIGQFC